MANPSLQIGNDNWAIKEDNLLGYSTAGTRFVPQPITMTRATAGTRVNPSGLVEDVELLGSEEVTNGDFSNGLTDWTENGGSYATIVSGALNSNNPDAGNWYAENISQNVSFVNGTTYKLTFKAKNISGNLNLRITQGANAMASLDLTSSFVDYTYFYTANADNGSIRIFCNSAVGQFEIDDISVKEATIDNLARVDYTDGTSSLLVEPQSTNSIAYSEDFSQWLTVGSPTLTNNYGVSPDGTQNSTRLEMVVSDRIYIATSLSGDITFSVYLKGTGSIRLRDNTNLYIEDVVLTSEWVRYELVFNSTITSVQIQQVSGTSDLQIWGAQCENLSYATSYIPTSGSTVTRNQDIFTRDGIGSLINSTEGVLFVESSVLSNDGTYKAFSLSDGTTSNTIRFYTTPTLNQLAIRVTVSGSHEFNVVFTLTDLTVLNKMALKYKANDFAFWVNGVEVKTSTSGNTYTANTLNSLQFDRGDGADDFYGKVKQLQVYNTALSDSELATLTT